MRTKNRNNAVVDRSMSPAGGPSGASSHGSPRLMTGTGWGAAARQSAKAEDYNPAHPWSDYALDQAAWRINIGIGTQADKDAIATQRPNGLPAGL